MTKRSQPLTLVSAALVLLGALWSLGTPPADPELPEGSVALSPAGKYKAELIDNALRDLAFTAGRVQAVGQGSQSGLSSRQALEEAEALLWKKNQPILALTAFGEALASDSNDSQITHGLGQALVRVGRTEQAEAAFLTALEVSPERADTLYELGLLKWIDQRSGEALRLFAESARLGDARSSVRLAVAAYYNGQREQAADHLALAQRAGVDVPKQLAQWLSENRTEPNVVAHEGARTAANIGPQTRVDIGGGTFAANETSIAAVNFNGQEIVATWNDWRLSPNVANEIINMGVAVSLDGGSTWQDGLVRPPEANQSAVEGDPMTAFDPRTGSLWVGAISFANNGGLYTARKDAGAANFEPSVQIGQLFFADKCFMAAGPQPGNPDATALYIAYNEGLWRSFDLGDTWTLLTDGWKSGIGFLPRVGSDGTLYIAYWDFGTGMKFFRSDDAGSTFSSAITAATRMDVWSTQDGSRFPGNFRVPSFGALAIHPQTQDLYYVYVDTTDTAGGNSNVDLYLTRSTNRGDSWSTPVIINGDNTPPGDQFFPWLEIDDSGRFHIVFHDSRLVPQDDDASGNPDGFFDVFYSYSDDGQSWTEARLTPTTFNSKDDGLDRFNQFLGDYNGLAFAGDAAFPLYLSNQNGDSDSFTHRIVREGGGGLSLEDPSPGDAGVDNLLLASGATPGARLQFVASRSAGTTAVPGCPGSELGIESPLVLGSAIAGPAGTAQIEVLIPGGASGNVLNFQVLDQGGCVVSNLVSFEFP